MEGVVDEIAEGLLEQQAVGAHDERVTGIDGDRATLELRPRAKALGHGLEDVGHVDGLAPDRNATLLGPGEQEQVVRDARQSLRVLRGAPDRRLELFWRPSAAKRQLELRLEQREWRAQLVARVGDEASLSREAVRDP